MNSMIESLECRQMFSVCLPTPAAPTPLPLPYPNTTVAADSGKVKTTEIVVVKTTDTASTKLM